MLEIKSQFATMTIATSTIANSILGCGFQPISEFSSEAVTKEMPRYKEDISNNDELKNSLIEFNDLDNGCKIDAFYFIKQKYNIDRESLDYIKGFNYAFSALLSLKNIIVEYYGDDVDVVIEKHPSNRDSILVNVMALCDEDDDDAIDNAVDNLFKVTDKWFYKTNVNISKNIYIDVVV